MININNYYLLTNWRPFSLVKQKRILENCNTAADGVC